MFWLLAALDSQIDLYPLVVLLQDSVIFAQRMPLPSVGQKNALHVGMSIELDAEHVEDLAFQPVRSHPDGNGTGQALTIGNLSLHANALIPRKRIKHPDHVELLFALRIVRRGKVDAVIELLLVAQHLKYLGNRRDAVRRVVLGEISQWLDSGTVCTLELHDHG